MNDHELKPIAEWKSSLAAGVNGTAEIDELDADVAAILLNKVQGRLPNWNARIRTLQPKIQRTAEPLPALLFAVNWASSGPGYDWPEAYFATPVTDLGITVITGSSDSTDLYDHCDYAIGWTRTTKQITWGAKKIITGWWAAQRRLDQGAWEIVLKEGAVSAEKAMSWRKSVWGREAFD
jgi:hypothetical protein